MIVVDTNLICYLILPGDRTREAIALLQQDQEWIAPRLWRSEFRNVLAGYLRKGLLTLTDLRDMMEKAEELMRNNEFDIISNHVFNLLASSNCSAYDCEFVALAQEFGVPLITVDRQILASFPETAVSPTDFLTRQ